MVFLPDMMQLDKPSPPYSDLGKKGGYSVKIISDADMTWAQAQLTLYNSKMESYRFQLDNPICSCVTSEQEKITEFLVIVFSLLLATSTESNYGKC